MSASTAASTPSEASVLTAPPEVWERVLGGFQRWCGRHALLMERLRRLVQVAFIAAIPLMLLAVLLLPRFGGAMVPALFMTLGLAVIALLSRTRTVSWRALTMIYGFGIPWAFIVALGTVWVAALSGLKPTDDGTGISLAAFVEESAKLVPLLLLCLIAPGRMRRFAAVDWCLAGFACGAAFVVAEDGARRLQKPGLLDSLLNSDLPYSLNP